MSAAVDWSKLHKRAKREHASLLALAEAVGVSDKTLRNYRDGTHPTPLETAAELEAYAAGERVLVHTADGWALFTPAAAPAPVPVPPKPTARKARSEIEEIRASAAAFGVELPKDLDVEVAIAPSGEKLTRVNLPTGATFVELRRPDGTIASRKRIPANHVTGSAPVDNPAPSHERREPSDTSAVKGLPRNQGSPRLAVMLDRIIHERAEPVVAEGGIKPVGVELTPELHDYLKSEAKSMGLRQSEFVRWLLRAYREMKQEPATQE